MYEQPKAMAEAQEITLQDALVRCIGERGRQEQAVQEAVDELKTRLANVEQRIRSVEADLRFARTADERQTKEIQALRTARAKDLQAWESWAPTWNQIPDLEEQISDLFGSRPVK